MLYQILVGIITVVHSLGVLFLLIGLLLTIYAIFFRQKFFDWWLFRSLHLLGVIYFVGMTLFRKYCPLTILEKWLRSRYDASSVYSGDFIMHYLRMIYPSVNYRVMRLLLVLIAVFIIAVFIARPPERIKGMIRKSVHVIGRRIKKGNMKNKKGSKRGKENS